MATTTRSSTPRRRGGPRPSPSAKGVYVPLEAHQMARLDEEREKLGVSRGRYLAMIFEGFGGSTSWKLNEEHRRLEESREWLRREIEPLMEASDDLDRATRDWSIQRQAIGVNLNQISRLSNLLRAKAREGTMPASAELKTLRKSLKGIAEQLDTLIDAEKTQGGVVNELRRLLDRRIYGGYWW